MRVDYIHHCGTDLTIVNAARVSFDKESNPVNDEWDCIEIGRWSGHQVPTLSKGDRGLLKYLAEHKHTSPFNHCFVTMRVKAPIFVARQLVRHEYMPWNEVSRRYVDTDPEFYTPKKWRGRAKDKKQGSSDEEIAVKSMDYSTDLKKYKKLIKDGVSPEQARMVLPVSMMTEWYWSGTLGAWAKMYNLRSSGDAQEETQIIAKRVGEIMSTLYPKAWEALTGCKLNA